jgi:hypothetical protein
MHKEESKLSMTLGASLDIMCPDIKPNHLLFASYLVLNIIEM